MVAQTSRTAYKDMLDEGKISNQQYKVLNVLGKYMTSRQITDMTGIERAAVTGRLNSLVKKKLVDDDKHIVCGTTGKRVKMYRRVLC